MVSAISAGSRSSWYRKIIAMRGVSGSVAISLRNIPPNIGSPGAGRTEGSVCLLDRTNRLLLSGDTLFAGSWGRTDLPGGSEEQMAESLRRLVGLEDRLRVLPGHGAATTIAAERHWLEWVRANRALPR